MGRLTRVFVTMLHTSDPEPFEYAFQLLSVVRAYGFGMLARVQRAYTGELEDLARRRERAADTARAIARERSRIARDMRPGGPHQHGQARTRGSATVELHCTEAELTVTITDDGRGPVAATAGTV